VYTLEKVLKMKRDAVTQVEFLEEVMKVGSVPRTGINTHKCSDSGREAELHFLDDACEGFRSTDEGGCSMFVHWAR